MTALDAYLQKPHRRTCTYWLFSSNRHCSCGRDEAIKALEEERGARQLEMVFVVTKQEEIHV